MSLHKTPQNKRNAIRYQFYDGEGRKEPLITIVPGKDNVTEIDISHFYSAEDSEVYHNIRALNPNAWLTEADRKVLREQKEEWARQYVAKFKADHGYEPNYTDVNDAVNEAFPKNWTGSLDEIIGGTSDDDDLGDKSRILAQFAVYDEEEISGPVERLRELVITFPERWQVIYQRVLLEKKSKTEVGAELGISDVRVGQIVRQIQDKIAADKILKSFFH